MSVDNRPKKRYIQKEQLLQAKRSPEGRFLLSQNFMPIQKPKENQTLFEMQEEMLKFWKENRIFERSVEERPEDETYSFYDGPPFITGTPHYGSILPSIAKDIIPRFQTMRGKRVRRVWGWDCHGLPAETKVEKKLGLKSKRDIEALGIDKFVAACREYVAEVSGEWRWYIDHIGRWADMDHAYRTMDKDFMETVIWAFKEFYSKGLIYRGMRSSLYCTRCATPLSKFEITMDDGFYRDVTDPAVTIKFKLKDKPSTFFLAWTTTPWTLPANAALAVDENEMYVEVEVGDEHFILAEKTLTKVLEESAKIVERLKGNELVGKAYEPLYSFLPAGTNDFKVLTANFVTMEDGTGIVHVAPAFGEADFDLGKQKQLTAFMTLDDEGKIVPEITKWAGMYYKKIDPLVTEDLKDRNLLLKADSITHSYPFCYRCETPLIYKAQDAWYLSIEKLRARMLETNKEVNWIPEHFKLGRFEHNLKTAPDWCLSRSRYWGSPIPVWECDACKTVKVLGSLAEIEQLSGKKITDLHRPDIDEVSFPCDKCTGRMYRVREVLDCWFESGAMPYAERHYPFENKEAFEKGFPADFIVEYTGQLRGWFYYLHVLGAGLKDSKAFKNVIATGVMKGNDGRKMSKSFGNYPDPKATIMKYGGEALRLYFMSSPIMLGEDMNVTEEDIAEHYRKTILILWNSYKYFIAYAELHAWTPETNPIQSTHILDRWIRAELEKMVKAVAEGLETYDHPQAVRSVRPFVENLSTWYIRRSRERFVNGDKEALGTLYEVLVKFSKATAPILPFTAEAIYQNLVRNINPESKDSVHLCGWKDADENLIEETHGVAEEMEKIREVCYLGNAIRKELNLAQKQPLAQLEVKNLDWLAQKEEYGEIVKGELNVKNIKSTTKLSEGSDWMRKESVIVSVALNITLSDDLKAEGALKETLRAIQGFRKEQGLSMKDEVSLVYSINDENLDRILQEKMTEILKTTHLKSLEKSALKEDLKEVLPGKLWLKIRDK